MCHDKKLYSWFKNKDNKIRFFIKMTNLNIDTLGKYDDLLMVFLLSLNSFWKNFPIWLNNEILFENE